MHKQQIKRLLENPHLLREYITNCERKLAVYEMNKQMPNQQTFIIKYPLVEQKRVG